MAMKKDEDRKVGSKPLSINLNNLLSRSPGFSENLKLIEKEKGVKHRTIRKWVDGSRNPELDNLKKVCEFLNLDIDLLWHKPELLIHPGYKDLIEIVKRIKPNDVERVKKVLEVFLI